MEAIENDKVINTKKMKLDESNHESNSITPRKSDKFALPESSEVSPISSSNTYNLCNPVTPYKRDKFTHKFTLKPAKKSPNEGRHLWSIFDTQSQVEEMKDPKNINKETSNSGNMILKNRRHLLSDKNDTQSQVDKMKSPVRINNKG